MNFKEEDIDENILGKRNGGFMVPEGYFQQMQKDILRKTSGNGFRIPDGYFDTLESRIQQRVRKPRMIHLNIINFKKAAIGIAASVLLVSGFFLLKNTFEKAPAIAFSEAKMNELSDEEIINFVDVADIKDLHIAETKIKTEDKTQKQIEDYLINNTDEPLMNEEL